MDQIKTATQSLCFLHGGSAQIKLPFKSPSERFVMLKIQGHQEIAVASRAGFPVYTTRIRPPHHVRNTKGIQSLGEQKGSGERLHGHKPAFLFYGTQSAKPSFHSRLRIARDDQRPGLLDGLSQKLKTAGQAPHPQDLKLDLFGLSRGIC